MGNRYKIIIEYNGAKFHGWQRQDRVSTVQETLETAILKISKETQHVEGSGRTDTGVHALGQVAHFDIENNPLSPFKMKEALNFYLKNKGVSVLDCEYAPDDFHARFSAKRRHYHYYILNRRPSSPILGDRVWHVHKPLDLDHMKHAAAHFVGHHDFTSFRATECQSPSPFKTLEICDISVVHDNIIRIHVASKSFLHNQVRIMVGTLKNIGEGRKHHGDIPQILAKKNRVSAGITAPAHGLYFYKVEY